MATTTNYSWTTPDDTDLVKDGAAAIRTLGSSIDTTTKALNPSTTLGDIEYRSSTANTNTRLPIGSTGNILTVAGGVPTWAAPAPAASGLTLISRTTFSASSAITIDNLFSDTYENYLIRIQAGGASNSQLRLQFRYGSTTHTSSDYDYAWGGVDATADTFRFIRNYGQDKILLEVVNTNYRSLMDLNVCRLNGSDRIQLTGNLWGQENIRGLAGGAFCATQQAWSGIYLTPASGTISGQVSVYGLAKS